MPYPLPQIRSLSSVFAARRSRRRWRRGSTGQIWGEK